jgi:hypothetical protein
MPREQGKTSLCLHGCVGVRISNWGGFWLLSERPSGKEAVDHVPGTILGGHREHS